MKGPTILVVEDNEITRKVMRVALAGEGYTVLEAPDGRTAIELTAKAAPDLILQDILLPDTDGFDLVRELRALPGRVDVPILAVSGFLSRLETARASALGFTDFLLKPVEPSRLVQIVQTYLPGPVTEKPGRGRRVLVADDNPIQLNLVRLHLRQLGFRVTTAANGKEALERARESPPDAILSDVLMPKLDGYQLCLAVRKDPRLGRIPVVLFSANYVEEQDRRLAEDVGASAVTIRTPDLREAIEALLASLGQKSAPKPRKSIKLLKEHRVQRIVKQLERQVAANVGLLQRASLQATILSIVAGVPGYLAKQSLDPAAAPSEILASILDAGGLSTGVLYLTGADGRLSFWVEGGPGYWAAGEPEEFFGHPELFERSVETGSAITVPSAQVPEEATRDFFARAGVSSAIIAPLVSRGELLGALVLGSKRRDLTERDWMAFTSPIAAQLAHTIALSRAFSQLGASEQRYRSLFDRVPVGLYRGTPDGRILDVNPALVELFGFPDRESLLAVNAADLYVNGEDRRQLRALLDREGVVRGFETQLRRRDGSMIWASTTARVVREDDGAVLYDGSIEDLTERKRAEEQLQRQHEALVQTEKLAAMGQLLAGVAHELNNPLSVLLGQAALLRETVRDQPVAGRVEKIAKAAERCARIVKNFLALARQHPPERQRVWLNQVVHEAVELLAYALRVDTVEVTLDLAEDLPVLWADPHQLHQVVVNLITNAHHAMRGTPPPRRLTLATRHNPQLGCVFVEVADTGPGIPPEITSRIFEPFFTTKPPGEGTGLGLSLCQGIIEAHRGTIRVNSQPGHGALFLIELPVEPRAVARPEARAAEAVPPIRGKVILVVDDEPEVAEVMADMLSVDGHHVETASNGALALDKLRERAYDLILSDVRMPELDGPSLYRELERRHPELCRRIIFLTGDTLSVQSREFLEQTGAPDLSKPFVLGEVRRVVQQVLRAE